MDETQLYEMVKTALDNAVENEYDEVKTDHPVDIANDLTSYDCDLEGYDIPEIAPLVERWQREMRARTPDEIYEDLPTRDEARFVAQAKLFARGWTEANDEWFHPETREHGALCFFPVKPDFDRIRAVKLQMWRDNPNQVIRLISVVEFPQREDDV